MVKNMPHSVTNASKRPALLLESATAVFLAKGFNGARMQEIANHAGVNKALLHYYFRNKVGLYEEVIRFQFKRNFAFLVGQLHADGSFATALRLFINGYIELLADNPQLPLFMIRELADGGKVIARVLRDILGQEEIQAVDDFRRLLNRAIRNGEIRRQDMSQLILTVIGACVYSFIARPIIEVFLPDASTTRQFLTTRKRAVFQTVYYGMKKREQG